MIDTIAEQPVTQWKQVLDESDYEHDYTITFPAITTNIVNLIFPKNITQYLITTACDVLISPDDRDFIVQEYMPVLQESTKDIEVSFSEKLTVLSMGIGVLVKIVFAFLY